MKRILLLALLFLSLTAGAQRTVTMNTLWDDPQVHVLFKGYTISYRIKDIDKALLLLAETGDSTFGLQSRLDTNGRYELELFPGLKAEYRTQLHEVLQRGVGAYLLMAGRAEIRSPRHKKIRSVNADIEYGSRDATEAMINFYDPANNALLFCGSMALEMYNKDMGLD
jgi:hypothetical protein